MRVHLMQSAISVCSGRKPTGATVIEDVVRHADVSRGTFYEYSDSLDEAVSQVASAVGEEMVAGIGSVYDVLEEPVSRTATGFQMFLARALIDPDRGAFITYLDLLAGNGRSASRRAGRRRAWTPSSIRAIDFKVPFLSS